MGLDQYFYKSKEPMKLITLDEAYKLEPDLYVEPPEENADEIISHLPNIIEFATLRKHADLHGYLTNVWLKNEKSCKKYNLDFNLEYLHLNKDDINLIKKLASTSKFKTARGFFWGETTPAKNARLVEICDEALTYIDEGYNIYYQAWY